MANQSDILHRKLDRFIGKELLIINGLYSNGKPIVNCYDIVDITNVTIEKKEVVTNIDRHTSLHLNCIITVIEFKFNGIKLKYQLSPFNPAYPFADKVVSDFHNTFYLKDISSLMQQQHDFMLLDSGGSISVMKRLKSLKKQLGREFVLLSNISNFKRDNAINKPKIEMDIDFDYTGDTITINFSFNRERCCYTAKDYEDAVSFLSQNFLSINLVNILNT